jgi:hypothetical protein
MLETFFTCRVSVKGDNLIIQPKYTRAFYQVRLDNISSVTTNEIPLEWLAATWSPKIWSSSSDVIKNLTVAKSGQSPFWRIFYTEGTFVNPKTHNTAFLLYKHRNKCITLVLKKPQIMTFQSMNFRRNTREFITEIQKATNVAVSEISFEVNDKEKTAESILSVLKGNVDALPNASMKISKKLFHKNLIMAIIAFVGIPIIILILIVLISIYFA